MAFSLHELARVLGSSLTCSELVPVLMEICTKDIDDVKIGALSHLAEFFEVSYQVLVRGWVRLLGASYWVASPWPGVQ